MSQPERKLLFWDVVCGWDDNGADKGSVMGALNRIAKLSAQSNVVFVLRDLHPFLNLPTLAERQEIFRVHLARLRPSRLREFDLPLLAKTAKDFSGAEIEQVVVDARHRAFFESGTNGQRRDLTSLDIVRAIEETVPLAAIARDQIADLKRWAAQAGARTASNDTQLVDELQQYVSRWESGS